MTFQKTDPRITWKSLICTLSTESVTVPQDIHEKRYRAK